MYRRPRHRAELRAIAAGFAPRRRWVPTAWDDLPRRALRCWKAQRRTQWSIS